jgi:hypothetical protein
VTVNTLKAANAFLKALRVAMRDEVGRRPTPEELETAFADAPVPGSATGATFARTPLGAAILTRVAGNDVTRVVSFDQFEAVISDTVADEDVGEDLMAPDEAAPLLDRAVDAGAVSAEERHLLAAILDGAPLADAIRDAAAIRRRVKADFDGDIGAYVADLTARVAGFSRRDADARP